MKKGEFSILLILFVFSSFVCGGIFGTETNYVQIDAEFERKFMPAYSFKSPFYVVRGTIPFWLLGGSTVITDEYARLTPAQNSRTGRIWGSKGVNFPEWEVELTVKIGSPNPMGADGMAFWYTEAANKEGPVYGNENPWKGLGVSIDTFDNSQGGDKPLVSILYNDGSSEFASGDDGKSLKRGSCTIYNLRNNPVHFKIAYVDRKVQVLYSLDRDANKNYQLCAITNGIDLPQNYYFGVSAATGGVSDNHDVISFQTYRLQSRNPNRVPPNIEIPNNINNNNNNEVNEEVPVPPVNPRVPLGRDFGGRRIPPVRPNNNNIPSKPVKEEEEEQQVPNNAQAEEAAPAGEQEEDPERVEKLIGTLNRLKSKKENDEVPVKEPVNSTPPSSSSSSSSSVSSLEAEVAQLKTKLNQQSEILNSITTSIQRLSEQNAEYGSRQLKRADIQFPDNSKDLQGIRTLISDLRASFESKSGMGNENILKQLEGINRSLGEMKSMLTEATYQQKNLQNSFHEKTNLVNETIEKSSSWWTYLLFFILFQMAFGFAFVYWRKFRDEKSKKLY